MNTHHETNPHFVRPRERVPHIDQHPTTAPTPSPAPWGDSGRHDLQPHRSDRQKERQGRHRHRQGEHHQPSMPVPVPLTPLHTHLPDEQQRLEPSRGPRLQRNPFPPHHGRPSDDHLGHEHDPQRTPAHTAPLLQDQHADPQQPPHHRSAGPRMPQPRKTKALTWFLAVFCVILWVVVILGGLIVLVVYLVFRPRSPRFEVSAASLNAAYLDMGYLLNADLSLLANFSNPNRKVSVEFSYMYAELYYGRTLVATQYLPPFTVRRGENMFANLHMVTSQVRLAELEVQRIKRQTMNNGIVFELKGFFRAKSNFGGLLRYSYWLHSKCTLMLTRPPGGVLVAKKCKTSH